MPPSEGTTEFPLWLVEEIGLHELQHLRDMAALRQQRAVLEARARTAEQAVAQLQKPLTEPEPPPPPPVP